MMRQPHDTREPRKAPVTDSERLTQFEQLMMPHMAAAYNLARWLTRQEQDASDVTQEAMVRAFTFFKGYHGGDARAWLLTIVRNTCYTWLRKNRSHEFSTSFDLDLHDTEDPAASPEQVAVQTADQELLRQAFAEIPLEYREILVLRELEGLSYREICGVTDLPMGTVMSRLSRARSRLQRVLLPLQQDGEKKHDL
jgi:RNA polymerase sigma-70 factor (ECF subfamily)